MRYLQTYEMSLTIVFYIIFVKAKRTNHVYDKSGVSLVLSSYLVSFHQWSVKASVPDTEFVV